MELTAGDVWWAASDLAVEREPRGRRPVVVVSAPLFHDAVTTMTLAVPVTSRDRGWDNHVVLDGPYALGRRSWAMTEQIRSISRERLLQHAGIVTPRCLDEMLWWIRAFLA